MEPVFFIHENMKYKIFSLQNFLLLQQDLSIRKKETEILKNAKIYFDGIDAFF